MHRWLTSISCLGLIGCVSGPPPVLPRDMTPAAEVRAMARAALREALDQRLCRATVPCRVLQLDPEIRDRMIVGAPPPSALTLAMLDSSDVAGLGPMVALQPFTIPCVSGFTSDTMCIWMALRAARPPGAPTDRLVQMLVTGGNEPMGLMVQVQLRRLSTGWVPVTLSYYEG